MLKATTQLNTFRLQWIKKYFETHYGGHPYDAVERRGGAAASTPAVKENAGKSSGAPAASKPRAAARVPARDVSNTTATGPTATASRPASAAPPAAAAKADENRRLHEELTSLKFTVEKVPIQSPPSFLEGDR